MSLCVVAQRLVVVVFYALILAMTVMSIVDIYRLVSGCATSMAVWVAAFYAVNWPFFMVTLRMDKKSAAFILLQRIYFTCMTGLNISGLVLVKTENYETCNANVYYWFYITVYMMSILHFCIVVLYSAMLFGFYAVRKDEDDKTVPLVPQNV